MVTYSSIRESLMKEMGRQTTNTAQLALFLGWIQDGQDEIVQRCGPNNDFMKTTGSFDTVADTATQDLTTSDIEITAMAIDDETPLRFIPHHTLLERGYDLEQTGRPLIWYDSAYLGTTQKYQIGLYPVPDDVYSINYTARLNSTVISLVSAHTFLPERFIPVLKDYVRWQFNLNDGSPDRADRYERKYLRGLAEAISTRQSARRIVLGEHETEDIYLGDSYVDFWGEG